VGDGRAVAFERGDRVTHDLFGSVDTHRAQRIGRSVFRDRTSRRGSRGRGAGTVPDWERSAGSSSARSPGSTSIGGCASATSAATTSMKPSSPSAAA
jgi:hypothetical protein